MADLDIPNEDQINKMNKNELQRKLKHIITLIPDQGENNEDEVNDPSTKDLLKQILGEMKKFNQERNLIKTELEEMKRNNALLLETVAQQQRFLEEIDSEKRAKNMIVLGISENDLNLNGQAIKEDKEKVEKMLTEIGYRGEIMTTHRLGKKDANVNRARPIKVVFPNANDRQMALALADNLNNIFDGALKDVKMKKDTHPAIRKEYGRLFEAERKEKAKAENVGKHVFFDKKKRLLLIDGEIVDRFKPSFF